MKDSELLSRFVHTRDQKAFAEVVRRHVDFVYAAALRHVGGDRAAAEDIAQEVFIDLARKSSGLANHPCLPGWLYASTRFTALNTIRREQRRTNRETEADLMHATTPGDPEPRWEHIRPLIDDAMQTLDDGDRQSVLLRFFGQQSFLAIGEQLGLSENAAQKRVTRALDRLNTALAQRGITSTSAALAIALGHAGVAAPTTLAQSATAAALASIAAGSAGTAGVLAFMSPTKFFVTLAATAVVGVAGGLWHATNVAEQQAIQRDAEFASKLSALQARVHDETKRADAAEADTANLLAAIERARVTQAAAKTAPDVAPLPAAPPMASPAPDGAAYTIMPGDTLAKIAAKRGLTLDQIRSLNPGTNWALLKVGQQVRVP